MPKKRKIITQEVIDKVIRAYDKGLSIAQTAILHEVGFNTVNKILKENNVKIRKGRFHKFGL